MSKMICNICGSDRIVEDGYYGGTTFAECEICNANGDIDFIAHYETLFDRITASPEVLAEEFVEMMYDRVAGDYRYYSMLTGEFYNSREEAIAATIEKLKEVENG
jgi:hypothetical protein